MLVKRRRPKMKYSRKWADLRTMVVRVRLSAVGRRVFRGSMKILLWAVEVSAGKEEKTKMRMDQRRRERSGRDSLIFLICMVRL